MAVEERRAAIEPNHPYLSITAQCELLGLSRSSYYYEPKKESEKNLHLMRRIDELSTTYPFLGSRKIRSFLRQEGVVVNRKRVKRLMRLMGIKALYCEPKTTVPSAGHKVFPYLLRHVPIVRPRQVWSSDVTYIRMPHGFLYLTAVLDWYSRFVLSWELSNSLASDFCIEALLRAFRYGKPEIFNSDQGTQFTCTEFIDELLSRHITISMDGRGRALDNIFIERLWRSVKYEEVYLKDYTSGKEAYQELSRYFRFYNYKRPHASLDGKTPAEIFLP